MLLFDYPSCPGSWQASAKFRFAEAPPSWVGPLPPTARFNTLKEALCGDKLTNSGQLTTSATAAIVTIALGYGGVRQSITGLKTHITGGYPSRKIYRPIEHESENESAFIDYSEVDPGVIDYWTQPLLFDFVHKGRRRKYSADFVRLLANGRIQVAEVKTTIADAKRPDYKEKLEAVSAICHELGWQFILVEGSPLRADNVFSCNIREIQGRRFEGIFEPLKIRLSRHFQASHASIAAGKIIDLCGGLEPGLSAICVLMTRRLIYADLRYQLDDKTPIFAVPHNEVAL